jgi:hypothetical protein
MLYEYATSLKRSDASGLLAFLSGWYLQKIIETMMIILEKWVGIHQH